MVCAAQTNDLGAPHIPVLIEPVIAALRPLRGKTIIDGTFGAGGYSRALLEAGAAHVIAIDRDPAALQEAGWAADLSELTLIEGDFADLEAIVSDLGSEPDAVVLDIGVSSMQLDQGLRGFSFLRDGPLDMRMSGSGLSAADLVNGLAEGPLADLIHAYGEERAARRIARAIVRDRAETPITGTLQLADVIAGCLPKPRPGQTHSATRTFQALRIAVNNELGQLAAALVAAERILPAGGKLAVVTFHSLEDRMVKRFFQIGAMTSAGGSRHGPERKIASARWERPARPVAPDAAEIGANPRARSARLRWAVRTEAPVVDVDARCLGMPKAPPLDGIVAGGWR